MEITINNKPVKVKSNQTVMEAADEYGIYIPRLCAHPELVPYGGCRLCIVEIEGRKGYPTSCTTMVEEGMIVRTETNMIQDMRRDLLQLILSEHPSACLLCQDIEGCSMFQGTIRKVGVTTGCRWCPKDKDCELQRIVESFDINELTLPGLYRDLPVEKYDPFFDRDYNLCIYCGRCVRICNEYRKSSVIALRQRGKQTTIGPSFDADHTDAGCEYCGACVSVCPTGAMSEKSRKWWGEPDKYTKSICPLCSINCEIQVLSLREKIVGTLPPGKPHEEAGELCVKGRFCLSELVNRTNRMLEPQYQFPEGYGIITWKEAMKNGGKLLKDIPEDSTAVFVSPDLSVEEYIAIAEFSDKVLKTSDITSSFLDSGMIAYQQLAKKSVSIDRVRKSSSIFSLFLNGNYNYGPLTMAVKEAASSGVPYYHLGWIKDSTSRFAEHAIIPLPGEETGILDDIVRCLENKKCKNELLREISGQLKKKNSLIIAGPWILSLSNSFLIMERIRRIVELTGSGLYMPDPHGNLKGMLSLLAVRPVESVLDKIEKGKIDLVYLIGDMPFKDRPAVGKIICQSSFPFPGDLKPDLLLPSTLWGETQGTWLGMNGSPVKTRKTAKTHDYALPHTEILSRLATAAGIEGMKESVKSKIRKVPSELKPHLPAADISVPELSPVNRDKSMPFVFVREQSPNSYMNIDLSYAVEGLNELVSPDHLMMNPSDAGGIDIEDNDSVIVSNNDAEYTYQVRIRKNIPQGVVCITSVNGESEFSVNPCYVKIRRPANV